MGRRGRETLLSKPPALAQWHTTGRDLTRQGLLPGSEGLAAHVRSPGPWDLYHRDEPP